ncbi:TetR/AcrR family transcriptional regulator [Clostridioides difficile]|nr:TetR/AcrR family transcriptional regulator [Clostridioides difficile]
MKKKPYHHGNLHTELIEEGLTLIHEEGKGNFSLRKLAKRVGVSPTACYNHFTTAEQLLLEMKNYVTKKFCEALTENLNTSKDYLSLSLGKAYVNFFAEKPHYFTFIYDNDDYNIQLTEDSFEGDFQPFLIFKEIATQCMEHIQVPKENIHNNLIVMWATAHGLAAMANMKGFHYEGDWGALTETLLETKIDLF